MTSSPRPRIAILGGGFTGATAASNLLARAQSGTNITIFEPAEELGRGIAYARGPDHHLLNVPAAILNTNPDSPGEFLAWARDRHANADDYLEANDTYYFPRSWFGDYTLERLNRMRREAEGRAIFTHVRAVAHRVEVVDGRFLVHSTDGAREFDRLVITLGNAPSRPLAVEPGTSVDVVQSAWDLPGRSVPSDARVVIVGAGLTMADAVSDLVTRGHRGEIVCVSRNGLRPLPSRGGLPDFQPPDDAPSTSASHLFRKVRQWSRHAQREFDDWRPAIDYVRRQTPELWRRIDTPNQLRLRRHARTLWDVHRYQMPPAAHRRIEHLIERGQFTQIKARFVRVTADGILLRDREGERSRAADVVVNATGFDSGYRTAAAPLGDLLGSLGMAIDFVERAGIRVDDNGKVLDLPQDISGRVFALGYLARANHGDFATVTALAMAAQRLAEDALNA